MIVQTAYPDSPAERNHWIVEKRRPKNILDPWLPYEFLGEKECANGGTLIPTATVFLTNRECPYRCLMCDLWKNTLDNRVPSGAIAAQIRYALDRLPPAQQIKLYNAGSFFDPQAIPPEDYEEIAESVSGFERVIVESHPLLIGQRALEFQRFLAVRLEVAIGLETSDPRALELLNKRFTLHDFQRAASFVRQHDMDLRVFLLVNPPLVIQQDATESVRRSLDFAFDAGASACSLIPTRAGNGAMEAIEQGYTAPTLEDLESAQAYGISLRRGRIFADLWDIEKFGNCSCSAARCARLDEMNRTQLIPPPISCDLCRAGCAKSTLIERVL